MPSLLNSTLSSFDLHVHLRGTMTPEMARLLADRNKVFVPNHTIQGDFFRFSDFQDFLANYDTVGRVIRKADDLRWIAYCYLESVARQGTGYVEFMLSPDHSEENGIPYVDQIKAVGDAVESVKEAGASVDARIIVTAVRHRGAEKALALAEKVAAAPHELVVGFGLTGNELHGRIADFGAAFSVAAQAGLGLTAHVGEWGGAPSVIEAVEALGLQRVGHGIRAADSRDVLEALADRGVGFEVCPSSNLALGAAYKNSYPLRSMIDAGCKVSICTDDPAHFSTTPDEEWSLARMLGRLSEDEVKSCLRASIDMAFCDEKTKDAIRQQLPP